MNKKDRLTFIFIFLFSIVSSFTHAYGAILPSLLISKFSGEKITFLSFIDFSSLDTIPYIFVICGTIVVLWFISMLNYRLIDIFARRMMCVVNEKAQEIILLERKNLSFGKTTGEVNYILKNAVDNIYHLIEPFCWNFTVSLMSVIFMVIQMFLLDVVIGFVTIGIIFIILISVFLRTIIQESVVVKIENTNAKIGNHFLMSLTNLPMITIFRSKKKELEELRKLNTKFYKDHKKRANIGFCYWVFVTTFE